MTPAVLLQRQRQVPPRRSDHYDPCDQERSHPHYVDTEDGKVRRIEMFYCFHYLGAGERSTCPFPARMCRVKIALEAV